MTSKLWRLEKQLEPHSMNVGGMYRILYRDKGTRNAVDDPCWHFCRRVPESYSELVYLHPSPRHMDLLNPFLDKIFFDS
jgi:hypothetical protein